MTPLSLILEPLETVELAKKKTVEEQTQTQGRGYKTSDKTARCADKLRVLVDGSDCRGMMIRLAKMRLSTDAISRIGILYFSLLKAH